jgi:hypothetical protein
MSLGALTEVKGRSSPGRATRIALIIASGLALGLGVVVAVIVASGPQKETVTTTVPTTTTTVTATTTVSQASAFDRALRRLQRLARPGGGPLPLP